MTSKKESMNMGKKKPYGKIALTVMLILMIALVGVASAEQQFYPGFVDKEGELGTDTKSWRIGWINTLVMEGASDTSEFYLRAVTVTADRFVNTPDASGTWALNETIGTSMSLANTLMLIGNSGGIANAVSISGDSSVTNSGAWTNDKIDNKAVDFGDVTTGRIQAANGTLWDAVAHSLTGDVTGTMVAAGTTATTIAAGAVDPSMLSAKGQQIMLAGSLASIAGSATNTVTHNDINNTSLLFMSFATTDDTDTLITVANSDHSVMTYVLSADPSTAHTLDYIGLTNNPSIGDVPFQIVGAFNATSAGGDATETVAVSGSLTTDLVILSLEDDGANDVTVAAARVSSDGTVTLTLSADPATAAIMAGIVVRPNISTDAATHTIAFASSTTTAGGSAVEAITVTGVLTTDIVIAVQSTKDSQTLEFCVATADTISCTFDADPSTDEIISWMVLRAV